jgi:hypothetical protein
MVAVLLQRKINFFVLLTFIYLGHILYTVNLIPGFFFFLVIKKYQLPSVIITKYVELGDL